MEDRTIAMLEQLRVFLVEHITLFSGVLGVLLTLFGDRRRTVAGATTPEVIFRPRQRFLHVHFNASGRHRS